MSGMVISPLCSLPRGEPQDFLLRNLAVGQRGHLHDQINARRSRPTLDSSQVLISNAELWRALHESLFRRLRQSPFSERMKRHLASLHRKQHHLQDEKTPLSLILSLARLERPALPSRV